MSMKKIKELMDLMNENDLAEMEVEQEGLKVRLVKQGAQAAPLREQAVQPPHVQVSAGPSSPSSDETPRPGGLKEVTSPMVGTFYRSPSPEAEFYVKEGDEFKKGDVLCIVEAMKLMNEVKAEFGGKIVEILVDNAESVEFGQALFLIEPV